MKRRMVMLNGKVTGAIVMRTAARDVPVNTSTNKITKCIILLVPLSGEQRGQLVSCLYIVSSALIPPRD